jgi:subtilisin family serine protease
LKVNIINYSGGGIEKSEKECSVVKRALDLGIKIVVAAGNEKQNINKQPYYPAMCDDRVIAVKNVDEVGNLIPSSNYTDTKKGSKELAAEKGKDVLSLLPGNRIGIMTGTSQSTPTKTGKMIKNWGKQ